MTDDDAQCYRGPSHVISSLIVTFYFIDIFFSRLSHLDQIVVLEADSQVQRGQERRVEDVGVGPKVQQNPAALQLVLLHSRVEGNVTLIITAVQLWEDRQACIQTSQI